MGSSCIRRLLFIFAPLMAQVLELHPPCNESLDLGDTNCENTSSIRYYLDAETLTCLPFNYTGCGGNGNNFETSTSCFLTCIPMDFFTCPANKPPVKRADGSALCNREIHCPKNSRCFIGSVIGLCCENGGNNPSNMENDKKKSCLPACLHVIYALTIFLLWK